MRNKFYYLLLISLSFVVACKKSTQRPKNELESTTNYSDSLYFKIGDRIYKGNNANSNGVSNGQTNVKPFTDKIPNRDAAYETAGMFWYGDVDSTYYGVHSGFDLNDAEVKIAFTKKLLTANLSKDIPVKVYRNNQEFFKLGKRKFSTDFEMENSTDGVVFKVDNRKQIYKSGLTSSRPGFSIFLRPDMEKDFQKDSKFEIFNVVNLPNDVLLVQAKFELNLFDSDGRKYRVTDGFYQKRVKRIIENTFDFYFIN